MTPTTTDLQARTAGGADEQDREDFREHLRSLLTAVADPRQTLARMERGGYDADAWQRLAGEMRVTGLRIPEAQGGQGFGLRELGIVLEEAGRVVYPGPLLATAMAIEALLLASPTAARDACLKRLADGRGTATIALAEPGREWKLEPESTHAELHDSGWQLTGSKSWVIHGGEAADLIISALADGRPQLFVLGASDPGIVCDPVVTQDQTRPLSHLRLTDARADMLDSPPDALEELQSRALALLACEQAGGAGACVELAVAHARERIQFGQPIGAFQAVRHRCADMFIAAQTATAAARAAVAALDDGAADRHTVAGIAAAACANAYVSTAASCIQVLGGTGFTWEHPAHLYLKRAKSSALMFGDAWEHRARIAPALVALYGGEA